MSDEYLWSKKGSDGEVEHLEDLLSEFRYVPERSFAATANVVAEQNSPRRLRWVFAFAVPAFAALILGFWFVFQTTEGSLEARKQIEEQPRQQIENHRVAPEVEYATTVSKSSDKPVVSRKPAPMIVKTIFRSRATKRQQIETLTAVNRLTSEEKYAYDRLMLALSIAGNKLKVVQDTIDRKSDLDQKVINSNK